MAIFQSVDALFVVAIGLFIATNIDTLVVIIAFFLDEDYHTIEIFVGYAAGFLVGLVGAIFGVFVATGALRSWAFLLGAIPISIGVWGLLRRAPDPAGDELQVLPGPKGRVGVVAVTAIGLNGENLAVYIPFFVTLTPEELLAVVFLYGFGGGAVFLVALLGTRLTSDFAHPAWIDRWLVPIVLIVVGSWVLVSGWAALWPS